METNIQSGLPEPSSNPQLNRGLARPRLWWPVSVALLFWVGFFVIRQFELPYFVLFLYSMASAGLLVLLFFAWWWTRRSIPLASRALGFLAVLGTGALALPLCDKSVGLFGLLFSGLPMVLTAWTVWMLAARQFGLSYIRVGAVVVMALAWVPFTLQRIDGVTATCMPTFTGAGPHPPKTCSRRRWPHETTRPPRRLRQPNPVVALTDWTEFRGPARDGVLHGVKISTNWNEQPPRLKWRRRVGPAWSSMTVVADRLFTQEQREENEAVVCYDAATGEEIWVHTDKDRFEESVSGAGPRGTPTFANGRIYTLGATGILNCLDAASGKKNWSRTITTDAQSKPPLWGLSGSPLVSDNMVYVLAVGQTEPAGLSLLGRSSLGRESGRPQLQLAAGGDHWWQEANLDRERCRSGLVRAGVGKATLANRPGDARRSAHGAAAPGRHGPVAGCLPVRVRNFSGRRESGEGGMESYGALEVGRHETRVSRHGRVQRPCVRIRHQYFLLRQPHQRQTHVERWKVRPRPGHPPGRPGAFAGPFRKGRGRPTQSEPRTPRRAGAFPGPAARPGTIPSWPAVDSARNAEEMACYELP